MPYPQLSKEGPLTDEIELIGIELAVQPDGRQETELEMHGIRRTIPYPLGHRQTVRVTIHTSNGDITMRCLLRPGNYQAY